MPFLSFFAPLSWVSALHPSFKISVPKTNPQCFFNARMRSRRYCHFTLQELKKIHMYTTDCHVMPCPNNYIDILIQIKSEFEKSNREILTQRIFFLRNFFLEIAEFFNRGWFQFQNIFKTWPTRNFLLMWSHFWDSFWPPSMVCIDRVRLNHQTLKTLYILDDHCTEHTDFIIGDNNNFTE